MENSNFICKNDKFTPHSCFPQTIEYSYRKCEILHGKFKIAYAKWYDKWEVYTNLILFYTKLRSCIGNVRFHMGNSNFTWTNDNVIPNLWFPHKIEYNYFLHKKPNFPYKILRYRCEYALLYKLISFWGINLSLSYHIFHMQIEFPHEAWEVCTKMILFYTKVHSYIGNVRFHVGNSGFIWNIWFYTKFMFSHKIE